MLGRWLGFLNPPLRCCLVFLCARFKTGSKVVANLLVQQKPSFALQSVIPKFCKNSLRKKCSPIHHSIATCEKSPAGW